MSGDSNGAVTTSKDSKSHRPLKKARRDTPNSAQASAVEALFEKQPNVQIPDSALVAAKSSANLPAPPEIVTNVQGSSAGAGSGEFHVYKAARRREYERIRLMEEEAKREEDTKTWEEKQQAAKDKDDKKTDKNRKRREKRRQNEKKKKAQQATANDEPVNDGDGEAIVKKKIKPLALKRPDEESGDAAPAGESTSVPEEENGIVIHDDV